MGGFGDQLAQSMMNTANAATQHRQQRKEQMTDEQRQARLAPYYSLFEQDRIRPEQLSQAVDAIYQDYAPEHRMSVFGRLLNRKKARQQDAQNAQGKQSRAQLEQSTLANAKTPQQQQEEKGQAGIDAVEAQVASLKKQFPNMSEDDLRSFAVSRMGGKEPKEPLPPYKVYVSPDGKQKQAFRVGQQPDDWQIAGGAAKGPKIGWGKDKQGFYSQQLDDKNQPIPGTENRTMLPPAQYLQHLNEHQLIWHDEPNGKDWLIPVPGSSGPALPGQPSPALPDQPAAGRPAPRKPAAKAAPQPASPTADAAPPAPPVKGAKLLGKGRETPAEKVQDRVNASAITKAQKDYDDAVGLATSADLVAAKPNDAINQKRLAVQLERLSAMRFTKEALDYVSKAGWGNTIQQWYNDPSTGALPADVMRQWVDGAKEYLASKKEALDAARAAANAPAPQNGGGGQAKTGFDWEKY